MTTCRGCGALFTEGHNEKICELVAQSLADRRDWLERESKFLAEFEALQAERDALAAQLGLIRETWDKAKLSEMCNDITSIRKAINATPVQCLAEIRAEAIESIADDETIAFVKPHCDSYGAMLIYDYISVRAAKVRQGGTS